MINKKKYENELFDEYQTDIENAQLEIDRYLKGTQLAEIEFSNDKWTLENSINFTRINILFSEVNVYLQNKSKKDIEFFKLHVKLWVSKMLNEASSNYLKTHFSNLITFLESTKGLTILNTDEILIELKINSFDQKKIILSAVKFFEYFCDEIENDDILMTAIDVYNNTSKTKYFSRILPSNRDIIVFSKILNDYFNRNLTKDEYLLNFPIWLWWNLTTIIPMRPTEFCRLKKDCIIKENKEYLISINRIKNSKNDLEKEQKLSIPKFIVEEIIYYQSLIDYKEDDVYLISYKDLPIYETSLGKEENIIMFLKNKKRKKLIQVMTAGVLKKIINSFYLKIVSGKYQITFDKNNENGFSRKLRPGDTRHLAFINLKRQGFHPLEIAYIGGHKKIQSQQHYFNHLSHFTDLKIMEYIVEHDIKKIYDNDLFCNEMDTSFINKYVIKPSNSDYKLKMSLGYCTDPEQNCRVENCFQCEFWRIGKEEFILQKDKLYAAITEAKMDIDKSMSKMEEIYKGLYLELHGVDIYKTAITIHPELQKNAIYLDTAIKKYVNISLLRERIIDE